MADLLFEIGAEEIPASYIEPALAQLAQGVRRELDEARLTHGELRTVATPRRLTLAVANVADRQADREEEVMGPPARAAFDAQGNPTKAAQGFARTHGVEVSQILRKQTPKGEYIAVRKMLKGRSAIELLAEILPKVVQELSFPKSMVWLSGQRTFARPVRSFLALLGSEVVPFTLFDVRSDRMTEGHPILCGTHDSVRDAEFESYKRLLRERCVIADIAERKALVRGGIDQALARFGGAFREEALLNEVTNLCQYPTVLVGSFDAVFLQVPAPVVEAAMMEHQRYFPVRDAQGRLQPHFIFISDRGAEHTDLVRKGNEQVLRARLNDAQFFDQKDRQTKLEGHVDGLRGVAFLKGLGSYHEKARRLEKLAGAAARALGLDAAAAQAATRAAVLCKADLLTEMVGEFPALQGEIGRIYALRDGESEAVASAIYEHYLPRSADGALPQTPAGRALSLAEKIDNLVSCFSVGLVPSGSQDPYALRRQSAGLVRIIEETGRHLDVAELFRFAQTLMPAPHSQAAQAVPKLVEFLRDRLFQMALDRGAPHDLINAALAPGFTDLVDFWKRLDALRRMSIEPLWPNLVAAVERTFNISKAAPESGEVAAALLAEELEKQLWSLFQSAHAEIEQLQEQRRYVDAANRYAQVFAAPLHDFFDKVFVNVDDLQVRNNRLLLLKRINRLFSSRIADLSQISTGIEK